MKFRSVPVPVRETVRYKKPIILSLFKIDTLNFSMYILKILTCPLKVYVVRLHNVTLMNMFFTIEDHSFLCNCKKKAKIQFQWTLRSSHQRCSMRKRKHKKAPVSEFLFDKVPDLIKKETLVQVFSCEFGEITKNTFLQNTSGRLLLNIFFRIKISQVTIKLVKFLDEFSYILCN